MRDHDPQLYWGTSDTYRGSLLSFLVIDPEQVGQKKIVLRVLILSTSQKACPMYVPVWFLAYYTYLRLDILKWNPETVDISIVGYLCKIWSL